MREVIKPIQPDSWDERGEYELEQSLDNMILIDRSVVLIM